MKRIQRTLAKLNTVIASSRQAFVESHLDAIFDASSDGFYHKFGGIWTLVLLKQIRQID